MKELLVMMASITPEEVLLDELQENLDKYTTDGSEESKNSLLLTCQMFILKGVTSDSPQKAMDMIKDMNKFQKERELFKPNEN